MTTCCCHVCGRDTVATNGLTRQNRKGKPGIWACHEHIDRVKCAIDSCCRTASRKRAGWEWICAEHWRRYCPPRSKRRRAYLGFYREAKRDGWTDDLRAKYWRFWDAIVASARARDAAGAIDMNEINRIMGWE